MSTIIHGALLLVSVVTIPFLLNKIPLATLAAVLLIIGYKLAVPNVKHFLKFMPNAMNLFLLMIVVEIIIVSNSDSIIFKTIIGRRAHYHGRWQI